MEGYPQHSHAQSTSGSNYSEMPIRVKAGMTIFDNLAQTLQKQQFCDLVFELTGSIKFHTHRLVIALWSPVMMNMLNQSSCRVEKVLVKTNLRDAFKQFVHFLYTGTFDGNITDIQGVLLLASTFQIPLLRDLCEKQLMPTVAVDNVISLFHISVRFQLLSLEWHCVEHIRQHLPEVAQHSELKDLTPEQFNTFLASQHVSRLNPEMKLFLIISWLTEQVTDRQHFLVLLLGHIDWSTVAQDFLTEISQTENFFTSHPSSLYLLLQTLHSASISLGPYTDHFEELRKEHNEILNNVVSSSVHIGTGKQETFQPIPLTVISGPSRDKNSFLESSDINECVETRSKSKKDVENDARPSTDNAAAKNVGSKKRIESKNSKEKRVVSNSANESVSSRPSSRNGDRKSSVTRSSSKISIESSSTRRKTLRPRKVVSNNSVSIVSNKSGSRRGGSQRGKETGNTTTSTKETKKDGNQLTDVMERVEDQQDIFKDEFDDDDEEDEVISKCMPKTRLKIGFSKSKMGRPRKGYEKSKFFCTHCEYVTRHSHLLDKHIRQVHESKRIIKCPICDFYCNWSKKLYLHMRADHYNNAGPPFVCDITECTYTNDKMNKLVEHRRSHTGDRPFMCDECKMSFRSKSNLYAHLKCHNDMKDFECPICSQKFKMKNTLEQHLVVHEDVQPYLCDLCGFATKWQSHLVAHKRRHTGDVFPCTFPACTYTTPKKSTLQAHMRSHLGIRQHVCDTCGKAFIEKSHLVRHKRIHTTEKQHKCNLCDYASHRQDKLREHMQKHEREANRDKPGAVPEPKKRKPRRQQLGKGKASSASAAPKRSDELTSMSVQTQNLPVQGAAPSTSIAMSPPSDLNVGIGRSTTSELVVEPHYGHNVTLLPKQEKEWTELELLARIGFNMADGQHQAPVTTQVRINRDEPPTNVNSNHCLTEFSEIFRGFDSSSTAGSSGGPSLHANIPHQTTEVQNRGVVVINPSEGNFPPPLPPSRTVMLTSFPSQGMASVQQRAKNPHPLVMVPNMSSTITTPQSYIPHHQHHQTPPQVTQHQQDDHHYQPRQHLSPISQQHQQILQQHQHQQQSNQSSQRSSNYTHYQTYPY